MRSTKALHRTPADKKLGNLITGLSASGTSILQTSILNSFSSKRSVFPMFPGSKKRKEIKLKAT